MFRSTEKMKARMSDSIYGPVKKVTKSFLDCEIDCLKLKKLHTRFYGQKLKLDREIAFYRLARAGYKNDMFELIPG